MKKLILSLLVAVGLIDYGCAQSIDQIRISEAELTKAYQDAKGKMDVSQREQLKQDEIRWIKIRDAEEAKSNNPQETHLKLTRQRITELQKLTLKNNNSLSGKNDFYSPSDKFPKNPKGIKVIGHFIVDRFNDGSIFLRADSSNGEKDVNRRFLPKNFNAAAGAQVTFTKDSPLFIASDSILGQYDVVIHQESSAATQPSSFAGTPVQNTGNQYVDSLLSLSRDVIKINQAKDGKLKVGLLEGLGLVEWGSSPEDVILKGDIDPGCVSKIVDYPSIYEMSANNPKTTYQIDLKQFEELQPLQCTKLNYDMATLPTMSLIIGSSQDNKLLTYFFSNRKLYAVALSSYQRPKRSDWDRVPPPIDWHILLEALKQKYGNPELSTKVAGNESFIFYKWENDKGKVYLLLKPHHDLDNELRKMMLPYAKAKLAVNGAVLNAVTGENQITKEINQVTDNAMKSIEEMVKANDKILDLAEVYYFSKDFQSRQMDIIKEFDDKLIQDQKNLNNDQNIQLQKAASGMKDNI